MKQKKLGIYFILETRIFYRLFAESPRIFSLRESLSAARSKEDRISPLAKPEIS
jgi:hypothetical protein